VRADLLESAIIQDVKGMFRDEQFMARLWDVYSAPRGRTSNARLRTSGLR
jgi:hypothetical protein